MKSSVEPVTANRISPKENHPHQSQSIVYINAENTGAGQSMGTSTTEERRGETVIRDVKQTGDGDERKFLPLLLPSPPISLILFLS